MELQTICFVWGSDLAGGVQGLMGLGMSASRIYIRWTPHPVIETGRAYHDYVRNLS